jgi:hypothetical protein
MLPPPAVASPVLDELAAFVRFGATTYDLALCPAGRAEGPLTRAELRNKAPPTPVLALFGEALHRSLAVALSDSSSPPAALASPRPTKFARPTLNRTGT